ncbi:peptidase inhibitor family I36 protein [Nonomuraea sp. B19D2]|uniref:peptidase inhibitor family I36 protein n=1 Tax=Nonomuraea sp. B19D2 TaxID=3159561 RepID=UPI0032DB9AE0
MSSNHSDTDHLAATFTEAVSSVDSTHRATGYDRCPDGYYCMFSGLNGSGDVAVIEEAIPDLALLNMERRAKSDWNRTKHVVYLYTESNYDGFVTTTGPDSKGNFYSKFRDVFTSARVDRQDEGPRAISLRPADLEPLGNGNGSIRSPFWRQTTCHAEGRYMP